MKIDAKKYTNQEILDLARNNELLEIDNCIGRRFIGCGLSINKLILNDVPGNSLGIYLDGATIEVKNDAQDAVGDTMNDGQIIVHGSVSDTLGYSMRGGSIYIRDNAGYRAGVHIKEYDKKPIIVVGGIVGSFACEYMAGGLVIILNKDNVKKPFGNVLGASMYAGEILIAVDNIENDVLNNFSYEIVSIINAEEYNKYVRKYSELFNLDYESLVKRRYYLLKPGSDNPYKNLYVKN